ETERATVWDFLGTRYLDLGRRDEAAEAFARAAELSPSPKILREWAMAEFLRERPERAAEIYRRLLERKPDDSQAWIEYAILSMQMGDGAEARRAAEQAARLRPEDPRPRSLLETLGPPPGGGGP